MLSTLSLAEAATINIFTSANNPQETVYGIRDLTSTNGNDLAGALITANYTDGTSELLTWQALDTRTKGEAVGTDIDLYKGDSAFELTTTRLLGSLLIQLAPASSIFDMLAKNEGAVGNTPTTLIGFPFRIASGGDALVGAINVGYSGIVNLAGRLADGDAYTDMLVDFTGLSTGGFLGSLRFASDMDTLRVAGDLTPVPLPASLPLLFAGFGGLGLLRSRKRKTT